MNFLLILAAVILVVFGAAAWIRPSPREKQLSELRMAAIQSGLQVSIKNPEFNSAKSGARDIPKLTTYLLYRPKTDAEDELHWQVGKFNAWFGDELPEPWKWLSEQPEVNKAAIANLIQLVPEHVLGFERHPKFVALYWQEKGQPEDVKKLAEFLKLLLSEG